MSSALLAQVSLYRGTSSTVRLSKFPFKWFFSRMAEGNYWYSKLGTNVPYGFPTKCCYFLSGSKIQYGHPCLWLADTFSTFSQERLQGATLNLRFFMGTWPIVLTFYVDQKFQDGHYGLCLADILEVDNLRIICLNFLSGIFK